jgi:hypothetical protein
MSSIVTAVPSGTVKEWCIQQPFWGFSDPIAQECANATRGTSPSDFETICCDGQIIDTSKDLYRAGRGQTVDLENLICCRIMGPQQGGLLPFYTGPGTQCSTGNPVPLASLAATNTGNVQPFLVTYTSASFGISTTADYIPTSQANCLWAYTASGVAMVNVTVPTAQITSLSSSSSSDGTMGIGFSYPTTSSTTTRRSGGQSTSTSSASTTSLKKLWCRGLLLSGLVIFGQYP